MRLRSKFRQVGEFADQQFETDPFITTLIVGCGEAVLIATILLLAWWVGLLG